MKQKYNYHFFIQPKFISGKESLTHLSIEMDSIDATRPLVIAPASCDQKRTLKAAKKILKDTDKSIGAAALDLPDNPGINMIDRLITLYNERGCDSIIAIGSGPFIHSAKALNCAVSRGLNASELLNAEPAQQPLKPFILIPSGMVSTDDSGHVVQFQERLLSSPFCYPDIICLDPSISTFRDNMETACTLAEALSDAAEAIGIETANPSVEALANAAIQLIRTYGKDSLKGKSKASLAVMNAALFAGLARNNDSTRIVRETAQILSQSTGLPLGQLQGALLPSYLSIHNVRDELLQASRGYSYYSRTAETDRELEGKAGVEQLLKPLYPLVPSDIWQLNIPRYVIEKSLDEMDSILAAKKDRATRTELEHWKVVIFKREKKK